MIQELRSPAARAWIFTLLAWFCGCGTIRTDGNKSASLPASEGSWEIETIVQTPGSGASLVLDSSGTPHIAFLTPSGLEYGTRVGSDWRIQEVLRAADLGRSCAMVLDSQNRPWIGFAEGGHPRLARWDAGEWAVETVNSDADIRADAVSLAFGPDRVPHVAFTDPNACVLWHAARLGDGWHGEVVDAICTGTALGDSYASLQVDAAGRPRIAYGFYNGQINLQFRRDLRYAEWNGGSWVGQTVEEDGMGACPSLALDASGRPAIAYFDAVRGALKVASWSGGAWDIRVADRDINKGCGDSSLVFDRGGGAHVSYLHQDPPQVRYAEGQGSRWSRRTVEGAGKGAGFTSLQLDAAGRPRLVYYDGQSYRYARTDGR